MLAIDADGDGKIDQQKEIVFTEWDPTATSDMQALRNVFDTNHNGQLDAGDDRYGDFRVVVTLADGSTAVRTFAQTGIASISLTEDKTSQVFADGSSIDGQTTLTKTNGPTRTVATVTLAADAAGHAIRTTKTVNGDGSTTIDNRMLAPDGGVASQIVSTLSADGLTRTMTFDDDGNGVVDRAQSDVTVVNGNGSRTRTLKNTDQTTLLVDKTTTTTSADGKTVTISRDVDGNNVADQTELRVINVDGSRTVTITDLNPDGLTRSQSVSTVSVDGQTRTTTLDIDGNGTVDLTQVDTTTEALDGTRTRTVTETNSDNTLRDRTQTISSADGSAQTVKIDADGNGVYELIRSSTIVRNPDGSTTTTETDTSASGGLVSSRVTTTSAGGLSVTTARDLDGNGTIDLTTTDVTVVNASNRVQTITERDGSGGLLRNTTVTKGAANGLSSETRIDTDGDGNDDQVEVVSVSSGGDVTDTLTTYSPNGAVVTGKTVTVTSADGLSKTVSFDYNGDNANDLVRTIATVVNSSGSSTVTTTDRSRNSTLVGKTQVTTSANGRTITTKSDVDGDGTYEFTTVSSTTAPVSTGIVTTTETTTSEDATVQAVRQTVLSADRNTSTVSEDLNGDGKNDRVDAVVRQSDGTIVETLSTYSRNEALTGRIVTTTSDDGLSVTTAMDVDGNATVDLTTTDVTVLNADGSRTQTVSVLGPTNALRRKLITTTSASGLATTIEEDLDGNGSIDLTTTDVATILNSGVRQEAITYKAGTKVIGTTSIQTSRSGLSITTDTDADGDGDVDTHATDVTTLGATGSKTQTVTNTNLDTTMRNRTQTVTSRDGKSVTLRNDLDGSGTWDRVETIVKQADGKVVRTVTGYDLGAGTKNYGLSETTSANGTSWTRTIDENGDGVNDEIEARTLTYNADGSTRETYTDATAGWNVAPGEYINSMTKYIDVSADGLSKNTTVYCNNQSISLNYSVSDVTSLQSDGGTKQTIRAIYDLGSIWYQSERRITTDAHGFFRREELEVGNDGRYKESTERTVNVDGSVTSSYEYNITGVASYRSISDTSADGFVVSTRADSDFDGVFDLYDSSQTFSDGSVVRTAQYKDSSGSIKNTATKTISFDGRTTTVHYDTDGNGTTDRSEETVTLINANGSTTTTRSDYGGAGVLRNRIVSTTSANGLSISATLDLDGDSVVDETFSDITTLKDDGSTSRIIKTLYDDGSKKSQTWIATSADGLTTTTRQDIDGDGSYDLVTAENTYSSGMRIVVVSRYNSSGTLIYKDKTTTSANGRIARRERDTNGDGVVDVKNAFHAVSGQAGSYDASLQNFMNSANTNVNHFLDENGVDWFRYSVGGLWSIQLAASTKAIAVHEKQISDIYDVILDRDLADVERDIPPIGMTFGDVIISLIDGTEFTQKYGTLTNAQFIERMHSNAYDRGATLSELKSWLTRLQPGGGAVKTDLVWDLAHSTEHGSIGNIHSVTNNTFNITGEFERDHTTDKIEAKILVDRLYVTAVARHITSTNTYIPLILDGTRTESQIASNLLNSTEFQTKYGTLSDQDFVAQMIANGLGRAATSAEKTSWASLIANGTISRADFVVAIASSPDYTPAASIASSSSPSLLEGTGDPPLVAADAASGDEVSAAPPSAQTQSVTMGGGDQASMLRLVQAMASMTPQGASETTLPFAAIPTPEHQLASPLH